MPFPLIPLAVLVGTALLGSAGGVKSGRSMAKIVKAKKFNKQAETIIAYAQANAVTAANNSQERISKLGRIKLHVLNSSVPRFVDTFEKIHGIEIENTVGIEELTKYHIDKQATLDLRGMSIKAAEVLGGLAGASGTGALVAFGAYSATMTFGSASTGTAIAALSGIAAKNATLAFLGGGALAVGGGGMALGTIVLGGLVGGPALLVFGIFMDAHAKKNLEKALSSKAEALKTAEELKSVEFMCDAIAQRADMYYRLLEKLNCVFLTLIEELEHIVSTSGADYSRYTNAEQNRVVMCISMAGAVKSVLDMPILEENGGVTQESWHLHADMIHYHNQVQSALE
jgi:hypothetical protein